MRWLLLALLLCGCGGQILKITIPPEQMDEKTWKTVVERDRLILDAVTRMDSDAFRKAALFMSINDDRLWCKTPHSQYELAKLATKLVKEGHRLVSAERNLEASIIYYGRVVQIARTWSVVIFDLGYLLFRKGIMMRFQARKLAFMSEGKMVDPTGKVMDMPNPPSKKEMAVLAERARVMDDLAVKYLTQAFYQFKNCYDARMENDPEPLRFMAWTAVYLNNLRLAEQCFKRYLEYPLKPDQRKRAQEYLDVVARLRTQRAGAIPRYRPQRQLQPRSLER